VKVFFDTSVLVAVFLENHQHHEASLAAFVSADKVQGSCAAHSLAEVYSVLTRLPGKNRLSGDQALLFLEDVVNRLKVISLDGREYFEAIREAAALGIVGGMLYDMLLVRCALKVNASTIYTWNVDDFRRLSADIVGRVRTP
jgi:predicted nucleic acid-binding protein